jgi:Flp pilus assembly protein TadB
MATMIATVNAVLAGSGVVLLLVRAADMSMNIAVPIGLVTAAGCLGAALYYQNRRFMQAFPNA